MSASGSFREVVIRCDPVRSLCWQDGSLIDVAGAGGFDRFTCMRAGADLWGVLYEHRGVRAVLLRNGKVEREVSRGLDQAEQCDFPVTLALLPSGKPVLIRCPEKGNQLEIEDAETGFRLTSREHAVADFLHCRLEVSPGGRYLLSTGLRWQSWRTALVFDLARALEDPATLNGGGILKPAEPQHQVDSATFSGADTLVVAAVDEVDIERRTDLLVWDLASRKRIAQYSYREPLGIVFASGHHAFSLYPYVKRIDLATGEIVQQWPHLFTGDGDAVAAFDPESCRLAVATAEGVAVLQAG